jgi:hypothetical protein
MYVCMCVCMYECVLTNRLACGSLGAISVRREERGLHPVRRVPRDEQRRGRGRGGPPRVVAGRAAGAAGRQRRQQHRQPRGRGRGGGRRRARERGISVRGRRAGPVTHSRTAPPACAIHTVKLRRVRQINGGWIVLMWVDSLWTCAV